MKVNVYKTKHKKNNKIANKLLSYSALSAAFLMVDNDAHAQCGTADATNPTLAIDIDGDGTTDVNLNFATFSGSASVSSTVPGVASASLYTTVAGTLTGTTFIGSNFSYYGCQPIVIPGQYGYGFYGYSFFQGDPALGSYTTISATAPIYLQVNALNTFQYYFTFLNANGNYVLASAAGSNNIVGVTAGASNLAVCGLIDNEPGVDGPNATTIGSVYDLYYYFFNVQAAQSVQLVFQPASVNPFPATTCYTVSYPTYGVYLPAALPIATFPGSTTTYSGPFAIASAVTSTGTAVGSNLNADWLAVQFDIGGETHNGWVQLEYDETTGAVTCVSTGYNACSLEVASMAGFIPSACIDVGQPDPQNDCDAVPIPTLSQWGLITLMLLLMSYGSLALTAFGRMLQQKEES